MSVPASTERSVAPALDPKAKPVLVVEEDAALRAYMVAVLERHGFRVIAAGSGEEALELLGEEPALFAVLDIRLPGMDGFAVAEELKRVHVIIVTGDPVSAYARAAGSELDYEVLPKSMMGDLFESVVAARADS
jgi:DNA-binding response OmpR family regulator